MVEENQKMLATMATPSDKAIPIKATNPGGIRKSRILNPY